MKPTIMGLILFAVACKSLPPVEPASDKSSALAVQVSFSPPLAIFGDVYAETVYFIRVENGNLQSKAGLIRSTWNIKDRAYVFNADPGEYAAVAGEYKVTTQGTSTTTTSGNVSVTTTSGGGTTVYTTVFPEGVIQSTRVKVGAGKMAYMGKYVLNMAGGTSTADPTQKFYAELIYPGSTAPSTGVLSMFKQTAYTGTVKTSQDQATAGPGFPIIAREDFGESKWSSWAAP